MKIWIKICLLLLLILYLSGCATNPVTGEKQFMLMNEQKEISLGEQMYPIYTQAFNGLFLDKDLAEYVNRIGKKIGCVSHRPNLNYEFNVINSSVVNAFALPGGKISITRGLIELMENEDQLAGVLGHEIGHVSARHSAAGYTRATLTNLGVAALGTYLDAKQTKYKEYYQKAASVAANLVILNYSREQEREADKLAMEYIVKAGYNPQGIVSVLEILQSLHKKEPTRLEIMFQSHPLSSERISQSKEQMNTEFSSVRNNLFQRDEFQNKTAYIQSVSNGYKHYDNGEELVNKEKFEEAIIEFKKAVDMAPNEALIRTGLASAYNGLKQYDAAKDEINISIRFYPELFKTRLLAGLIYYQAGGFDTSIEHLNIANRLVPDNVDVNFYLGLNYEKKGNNSTSAEYYKKVLILTQQGPKAKYAYERLVEWGYIQRQ